MQTRGNRGRARPAVLGALLAATLALAGTAPPGASGWGAGPRAGTRAPSSARVVEHPDIVFFVADDMAAGQLRHLPSTRRLIFDRGARFTDYYTNISLCCPARATLLTGKYAHNTGITGNEYPDGFYGFHTGDERRRTIAVALRRRAGYRTSLLGKYLNEYPFVDSAPRHGVRPTYVPRGWSDWAVPVRGQYYGVDYDINVDGRVTHKQAPRNYLGDFLMRRAVRQISSTPKRRGLAMVLSFYGPHEPAPASPVERGNQALRQRISRIRYPRTPDFNERDVSDKPRWVRSTPRLGPRARRAVDRGYRQQALSLASIDRHVRVVVRALRRSGRLDETYLVFTSDNGYHMGSHRLRAGKNSPYVIDTHMPFAIRGPGIDPGTHVRRVTGPIDVAPTFADMAGTSLPWRHDGESVLPLARGNPPGPWRDWVLVQHGVPFGGSARTSDEPAPRAELLGSLTQPPYRGVLGTRWRYVRYGTGEEELYDDATDPYQVRNIMARPPRDRTEQQQRVLREARRAVRRLRSCSGVADCRV